MSLEFVRDDLGDATHAVQDKIVLQTADYNPSSLPLTTLLLSMIVSTSEETLDPKHKEIPNAKALLQEHPALVERLRGAWRDRTFKEI
jgi:hypothetical protein